MDKLIPLKLPPGMRNTGTVYQAKNRWYTGNFVRFFNDTIQPIGGWTKRTLTNGSGTVTATFFTGKSYTIVTTGTSDFTLIGASANTVGVTFTATNNNTPGTGTLRPNLAGTVSAVHSWSDSSSVTWIAIGTTQGLFVVNDATNVAYDITPLPFLTSSNCVWSLDNFGGWLVAANGHKTPGVSGGSQYPFVWKGVTTTPAVQVDTAYTNNATATGAYPYQVSALVTTPERFLLTINGIPMPSGTVVDQYYANG